MAKATQTTDDAKRDHAADEAANMTKRSQSDTEAAKAAYDGGRVETFGEKTAPVIYTESAVVSSDTVNANGVNLKVKRRVAMPVLPFVEGMTIVCRIVDAIHKGKAIEENNRGAAKMETPMVCTIMSLSGEMRTLIAGAVLHKELDEAYPADSYVGGWFHITRLPVKPGKRYSTFIINEIEAPTPTDMDAFRKQEAQAALAAPASAAA